MTLFTSLWPKGSKENMKTDQHLGRRNCSDRNVLMIGWEVQPKPQNSGIISTEWVDSKIMVKARFPKLIFVEL